MSLHHMRYGSDEFKEEAVEEEEEEEEEGEGIPKTHFVPVED